MRNPCAEPDMSCCPPVSKFLQHLDFLGMSTLEGILLVENTFASGQETRLSEKRKKKKSFIHV